MATLLRLDTSTTFLAFTSPRALNNRFASATRSRASVSVRTKTSPFYSDNRRKSFSASASATSLAVVETEDPFDVPTELTPDNRIPATIITGFLGSDDIAKPYIDWRSWEAYSCDRERVRGDLVRMISELVSKKKGRFDHIVIETTGLANPAPIIQTFYAEDEISNDVKLDGVVTLVDAKHARLHLDEVKPEGFVNEAVEQIAYADRIIVNKTDLVGEQELDTLMQRIKTINSMAHMKRTKYGKVDLDYVLGIGGFDLERIENSVNEEEKEDHDDHHHDHDHGHDCHDHHKEHDHEHGHHDSHDHTHDPGVSSVSLVCEGDLDLEKANMWLGALLFQRSEDIYRMKGILSVQDMEERFVFQGVHEIFEGSPDRLWQKDETRTSKIVFIGKNLNREELEMGFRACLV